MNGKNSASKTIKSVCGKDILLDAEWADFLAPLKWYVTRNYAMTMFYHGPEKKWRMRKRELIHRIIMGALPGQIVDHKNHDTLDNRVSNLRVCTIAQNVRNQKKRNQDIAISSSRYKGVTFCKQTNSWSSSLVFNKKRIWLKRHKDEKDAAMAYNEAAKKYHGEFAYLNVIE